MPEGDTVLWAATRMRPALTGRVPDAITFPQRRHAMDRWGERLAGRAVEAIDTHGKNLFIRFGDLVLHSHLRMSGAWHVQPLGARWRRGPSRAWLVIQAGDIEVIQFDGPVLQLMTASRLRFDQHLVGLGPDILAPGGFDVDLFLARQRAGDQTRSVGDALLDQRTLAGIGNIWKSEGCWEARIDPWRPAVEVSDAELRLLTELVRPRMLRSGLEGPRTIEPRVYGRAGRPCPRCGGRIQMRRLGDGARITFWCPDCQH